MDKVVLHSDLNNCYVKGDIHTMNSDGLIDSR